MPWSKPGGDQPPKPEGNQPSSNGDRNPWGGGSRNNSNNGGPNPWGAPGGGSPFGGPGPDLEALVRQAQEKLRNLTSGDFTPRGLFLVAGAVVLLWLASGFYTVDPNQVGLNLVFGRYVGKTSPGLNYNWPTPIGSTIKLDVTDRNSIDIGSLGRADSPGAIEVPEESLMLTGDENIVDLKFRVIWQIDPAHPEYFAFNIKNQVETIKAVSESVMREIVGRTKIQPLLTVERKVIEPAAQEAIQKVLDSYKAGVTILQVQLLSVDPPPTVIAAFRDVTAAQQDRSRFVNEAQAEANSIVPKARGDAARILRDAEAYREQTVAEARGQTARYNKIFGEYQKAPEVTRERLYLETMERVLGAGDKVILDRASGTTPLLPLAPFDASAAPGAGGKP
ncbi:MAG TPA: FtsH protease activity modulator HflK [Rhodoblastus sp.]|nr:FtsH protease activity modulator HflK [Rhodoblastus sp.]